jgi:hypothetical protein
MLNQPQLGLNRLKRRSLILYQTFNLIAVIILLSSLVAALDNGQRSIQDDQVYVTSAGSSVPLINCNITRSNIIESIRPKKTISYNNNPVYSAVLKLGYSLQAQTFDFLPAYTCTYFIDCQQVFLLLDLPPPSLL